MFTLTIYNKSDEKTWQGGYGTFQEANHAAIPLMCDPDYIDCTIVVADATTKERICNWKNTCLLLTVDDYKNAIDACSACNVSGLIGVMNEVKDRIWATDRKHGIGTYFVNHHPIIQLYAYQIAYLSHGREPIEWSGFSNAYKFCKAVVAGEIMPDANWMESITTCYHNKR